MESLLTMQARLDFEKWLSKHPYYGDSNFITEEVTCGEYVNLGETVDSLFEKFPRLLMIYIIHEWLNEVGFFISVWRDYDDKTPFYMWQLKREDGFVSTSGELNRVDAFLQSTKKANEYYNYFQKLITDGINNTPS